jgi:hypothetical protein
MNFFKLRLADWTNYKNDYDTFISSLDRPRFLGAMVGSLAHYACY